jgi:hypothetical protein
MILMFTLRQAGALIVLTGILGQVGPGPPTGARTQQPAPTKPPAADPAPGASQDEDPWAERAEDLGMPLEKLRKALVPADLPETRVQALLDASGAGGEMKRLLRERYQAARTHLTARWKECWAGRGTLDILLSASRDLLRAELELCRQQADRVAVYQAHAERMRVLHRLMRSLYHSGRVSAKDAEGVLFELTDAELWLRRQRLP